MAQILPGVQTTTLDDRVVRIQSQPLAYGPDVTLDSSNTDAGSAPTTRFRPGNVVVLRTSTGRYVEANDANGDRNTSPSITSAAHGDGNGAIAVVLRGGAVISVTTTTGAGTEANNATDCNADDAFASLFVASSAGGELTITAKQAGADVYFHMDGTCRAGAGFALGEANAASGADADYRVTEDFADLADEEGTAVHAPARNSLLGFYDESNLLNLSAAARAVLSRRGSHFA